jgi:hypothetical protein
MSEFVARKAKIATCGKLTTKLFFTGAANLDAL